MFKLKNVGEEDFLGGSAEIKIHYPGSIISHTNKLTVPKIKREKTIELGKISRSALGKGYASFFGKIKDKDGKLVQIVAHGQVLPEDASFYDIFIESRAEIYTYWILIISMISLVLLIISLIR